MSFLSVVLVQISAMKSVFYDMAQINIWPYFLHLTYDSNEFGMVNVHKPLLHGCEFR